MKIALFAVIAALFTGGTARAESKKSIFGYHIGTGIFNTKPRAEPSVTNQWKPMPVSSTNSNMSTTDTEEVEELDPNAVYEASSERAVMNAEISKDRTTRCEQFAPVAERLRQMAQQEFPSCQVPTAAEFCATWDVENGMKLGAPRGEPCPESRVGARGCTQFMPDTWKEWGRDGNGDGMRDPQTLEDASLAFFVYSCKIKQIVARPEYVYMGYNWGPYHFNDPLTASTQRIPKDVRDYDLHIRGRIPMYAAALGDNIPVEGAMMASVTMLTMAPIDPGKAWITAIWGEARQGHTHMGHDWGAESGVPVKAIAAGRVEFAGLHNTASGARAGIQVQLTHGDRSPGTLGGSRYFHLQSVAVSTGANVKAGEVIGYVGRTGVKDSGTHLHWEALLWKGTGQLEHTRALCLWVNCAPYASNWPQYVGPKNESAMAAARKFDAMNVRRYGAVAQK